MTSSISSCKYQDITSDKLASRTWEKDRESFYSQDKATVKMERCHNKKMLQSEDAILNAMQNVEVTCYSKN